MEQIAALWKYCLSFLKSEWSLSDYPIKVVKQKQAGCGVPKYHAQIINWWVASRLGETRQQALDDLQRFVDKFRTDKVYLPRPGSTVSLEFAPSNEIEKYGDIADDFFERILGISMSESLFISDASSLYDFTGISGVATWDQKVKQEFGVDISDIEDRNLSKIFRRIHESR